MRVLIVITARGGSKGFLDKNLRCVGGIPLVGRAVRVAAAARQYLGGRCRVICSTDSPRIAEVARAWGAETPFLRPAELASDSAKSIDVVYHACEQCGGLFDVVVLIQPTSPLVEVEDVLGVIETYHRTQHIVVSVCACEHPVEWTYRLDADGRLHPVLAADFLYQRQLCQTAYRLNGAIYAASPGELRTNSSFLAPETCGYVMPAERSIDIDSIADLQIADAILSARSVPEFEIGGRIIGPGRPCFIIAEAGVNHNGNVEQARRLIDAAVEAKVDAVKFQTFHAETLMTFETPKAAYQKESTGASESQLDMIKKLELPLKAFADLKRYCERRGIMFLSTPFDFESAEYLDSLGMAAIKIPSGEITNHPFLSHLAKMGKPLIVSTGMSHLAEIADAVQVLQESDVAGFAILHCVSNYPAAPANVNLLAMDTLARAFSVPVGYSDHVPDNAVALAAVARGACIIEKHFTLDRTLSGPDHRASIEPDELAALVRGIRIVESALGDGVKRPMTSEIDTANVARRSLVAATDLPAGVVLSNEMLTAKRPGTGISPARLSEVLGRTLCRAVPKDTLLTPEDMA